MYMFCIYSFHKLKENGYMYTQTCIIINKYHTCIICFKPYIFNTTYTYIYKHLYTHTHIIFLSLWY